MKAPSNAPIRVQGLALSVLTLLLCTGLLAPSLWAQEKEDEDSPLIDLTAQGRKKKGKPKKDDKGQELEGVEVLSLLSLSGLVQQTPDGKWEIVVKGTASIPDDLELTVSLHYAHATNDARDIKTHVPVEEGEIGMKTPLVFGPYDRKLTPNGWFWAVARFRIEAQQNNKAVDRFKKMGIFRTADQWEQYVDFSERCSIRLGTPAQERREDAQRRKHYLDTTKAVREILEEFDAGLVMGLRAGFPGGAEWREYVRDKRLLTEKGDDLKKRLEELKDKGRFVKGGKLEVDEWREFLDRKPSREIATHPLKTGGLRGRILRLLHDHKEFRGSVLRGKLPKADERIERLIPALYGLTMRWSRVLYKKAGLAADPGDVRPTDKISVLGRPSHGNVRNLANTIDKEVEVWLPK